MTVQPVPDSGQPQAPQQPAQPPQQPGAPAAADPNVSKEEQIGFHKGSLSTLAKERQELSKILNIVEQLMQMHVKALQELGIDLVKMAQEQQGAQPPQQPQGDNKPLEDALK